MTSDPLHEVLLLARTHRSRGDHAVALRLLEWALGDPVLAQDRSGSYAEALVAFGDLQRHLGDHRRACASYWRAMGVVPFSTRVRIEALSGLAEIERVRGRRDTAEALLREALGVAGARGEHPGAEALARRALAISERAHGSVHPSVAADRAALASVLDDLGRSEEAEAMLREAADTLSACSGRPRLETAIVLERLAALLLRRAAAEEAEAIYRRALVLKQGILGPDHPEVASTLERLGALLAGRGRHDEAESCLFRALQSFERHLAPTHPTIARCLERYTDAMDAAGRGEEVGHLARRAELIRAGTATARHS